MSESSDQPLPEPVALAGITEACRQLAVKPWSTSVNPEPGYPVCRKAGDATREGSPHDRATQPETIPRVCRHYGSKRRRRAETRDRPMCAALVTVESTCAGNSAVAYWPPGMYFTKWRNTFRRRTEHTATCPSGAGMAEPCLNFSKPDCQQAYPAAKALRDVEILTGCLKSNVDERMRYF